LRSLVPLCDAECEEVFRIERGIPRWGRELTEEIIPTEANLESSVIDYSKGCYIGQEVISRIKMSGQTNKRLCGLITTSETPLPSGARLWIETKDVGWITSACRSSRLGSQIALGFVKRGYDAVGTQLVARFTEGEVFVEITPLPFL
jgi:folate-binding protein YgfZ